MATVAIKQDLTKESNNPIFKRDSFNISLTAKDSAGNVINFVGYSAKSQLREPENNNNAALTFSVSSGLGPNGVVSLSATTSQTASLSVNKEYDFDVRVSLTANPSNDSTIYWYGKAKVYETATQ